MKMMGCTNYIVVEKRQGQKCREYLETLQVYDTSRKMLVVGDTAEIPVISINPSFIELISEFVGMKVLTKESPSLVKDQKNKLEILRAEVIKLYGETSDLVEDLPSTYELYNDLILVPSQCLRKCDQSPEVFALICDIFSVKRIARKNAVVNDKFRSPRTDLLLGSDPWVWKKENGIKYNFNIRKSMFCRGNISEKLRVAKFDCSGEVVVDLFAGIGYFVLPYLVHANAKHVYACEWNRSSVEALKLNLKDAGVEEKCTVLLGDNREVCPEGVADRVNLGLIPSSSISWKVAVNALKSSGGILHVHTNVEVKAGEDKRSCWQKSADEINDKICNLLKSERGIRSTCNVVHIECVKSYGPRIYHLVIDLQCLIMVKTE
ncbi:tRNA wybutosine-synthesizing protein 2 homolog isoform X2 [Eurytemora carolleeae]|uniref:tRNA wybutosine-synthesizing protein 2 homolog isoform X2 n=1 Tax=Eurytemora carolleeae TaxID=1294199 RepID=UPI000C77025B|nr:tRNA wybutosine-synthesizing protein 2 homolog isoform X2 [Eurytemora carolleeae]|eukprot:XP_023323390.1 tRNA wybutosine-synthesizing protein 2 homolog isoform X2 [Eurytemora affinis]